MAHLRSVALAVTVIGLTSVPHSSPAAEPAPQPVTTSEVGAVFEQVFGKRKQKVISATQMPVFLHEREIGLVKARVQGETVEVDRESFRARMASLLRRSVLAKFDELAGQSGWISADQLRAMDITLTYRVTDIALDLDFPVSMRPVQVMSVGSRTRSLDSGAGLPTIQPEPWSLIGNVEWFTSQNLSDDSSAVDSTLTLNFAGRWQDWVFEQGGSYLSRGKGTYQLNHRRLVRDWTDQGWRMWVGDVFSPGGSTLSSFALGGVRLATFAALRPDDTKRSPPSTTVALARGGTVHVKVNEVAVNLLRLRPGVYDLRDVPVYHGANAIELVVTEPDGKITSYKMDYFFDSQLLPVGKREFDLAFGFPLQPQGMQVGYDTGSWVASGWLREGWLPTVTGVLSVEAASMPDFSAQAIGTELAWSAPLGMVAGWLRLNRHPRFNGYSAAVQWQSMSEAPKLGDGLLSASAQLRQTGAGYSSVVSNTPASASTDVGVRIGYGPVAGWSTALSTQKRWSRAADGDRSNWTLSMRRRLAPGWEFDFALGSNVLKSGRQSWFSVGLNFTGMGSADRESSIQHQYAGTGYQSQSQQLSLNAGMGGVVQMLGSRSDWSMAYGQMSSGSNHMYSLAGTIANPRLRASTSYRQNQRPGKVQQSLSTYLGSSVVVSPSGGLSWGAMVTDSAIQFKPRKGYENGLFMLDPTEDGRSAMSGDVFGTPHMGSLRSYSERKFLFDVMDVPPGYPPGNGMVAFNPPYRSVSVLEYGATALAQVRGSVLGLDGKPHAMKALRLVNTETQTTADVFTSRSGKFVSPYVPPGRYGLKDAEQEQLLHEWVIDSQAVGMVELGEIRIGIAGAKP